MDSENRGRRTSRVRTNSTSIIEHMWMSKSGNFIVEPDESGFVPKFKTQYLAALAANFGAFAFGTVMSWSATALPDIRNDMNFDNLTLQEESFVASIVALGCVVSGPVTGFSVERFGRRQSMLMLTPPFLLGWLLIYFATSVQFIYVGRLITGFCGGAFTMAAPIFTAEMASASVRGMLAAGFDMMITVGQLYIFVAGAYLPWRLQALACAVIPLVFHVLMCCVPESPRYLMSRGKREDALKALCWFRGADDPSQVEHELENLNTNLEESTFLVSTSETKESWRDLFQPAALKPVLIILCLFMVQELCAIDAILFFTVDIFQASGVTLSSYLSTIVVGIVQVLGALCAASLVDRSGRRFLLLLSESFMALALTLLGGFFYAKVTWPDTALNYMGWTPLTALIVFVVAYSIGLGPVTYMIMGELLPPRVKGLASSILIMIKWITGFLVAQFFEDILLLLGDAGGYWLFSGFCFLGVVFVYFFLPETKGKTLEEIQRGFAPKKRRKSENAPLLSSITPTYGTDIKRGAFNDDSLP